MRAWRALKAQGAAVLRDGVYLLPTRNETHAALKLVADDVRSSGGEAYQLQADGPDAAGFDSLFDRSSEFSELFSDIAQARAALTADTTPDALKQARKLRKTFAQLAAIDYFPGEAQRQSGAALTELESACQRLISPDEPRPVDGAIRHLRAATYRNRLWATRARPWVDRLASAWLIKRFIDPDARFLWLDDAGACPRDALGFDFDGARFSHVGARVTFETLMARFDLEAPALQRLGAIVHYLDVGGVQPPEAAGIARMLGGLRESITNDDQLLATASMLFDGLLVSFEKDGSS